jgi:23S rRNA (pseudouridine1915-N3)-methyltransferase
MITVFTIEKKQDESFEKINENYKKMIGKFTTIKTQRLFDKKLSTLDDPKIAKKIYTGLYDKHLGGFNVALHPSGKVIDSIEFSKLISDKSDVRFFIGGAYGFNEEFLSKSHQIISLSKLTFAHKIAKSVLFEQIYRALSIKSGHPYHK